MSSIIGSDQIKNVVLEAIKQGLKECAYQHEASGEPYIRANGEMREPTQEMRDFANTDPSQLKITLEFQFGDSKTRIWCQPIIDLTRLGIKQ